MTELEYDKLTNLQKIIVIAELCGWVRDTSRVNSHGEHPWNHPDQKNPPLSCYTAWDAFGLYEYLDDLNACYVMEDFIPKEKMFKYSMNLVNVCCEGRLIPANMGEYRATAKQRCKAFVLTMTNKGE